MWTKPFKTIFQKPLIFLGSSVTIVAAVFSNVFSLTALRTIANIQDVLIALFVTCAVYLLVSVFVTPPIRHYAYEVCSQTIEKGWYKRGLKRSWWKVITWIAITIPFFIAVAFICYLLLKIPLLGFLISVFIILTFSSFVVIGSAAVIAEENFATGFKNTFAVGDRFVAKLMGTYLLFALPYGIMMLIASALKKFGADTLAITIVQSIYQVIFQTFLFVFAMHFYIDEKQKKTEEEMQPEAEKPKIENYDFY